MGALLSERYRLESEVGRGGLGVVVRAHDTLLDRAVAVKLLRGEKLDAEGRARLLREARAAARLNHPHVLTVHDAGEDGDVAYIVMELAEGGSLHEAPPTDLGEALDLACQVCAALEHAHAHGIVHRDLKPENVLLARDPAGGDRTAKLADFGLARSVASRLTAEGTISGSVFYLAPEQALGQPAGARADLYALGVMLYELVTGELPFVADDPLAVISQHLYAPPVPPRARVPGLPPALDALILRLLAKSPAERPASAAEVGIELERLRRKPPEPPAPDGALLERIVRGRLVAREQELAQARQVWRQAAGGQGGLLLISGEPGIGKTRLVRELVAQVRVSGGWALVGECYAEGSAPYAPYSQMLRSAVEAEGGPAQAVRGLPRPVLAELLRLAPALAHRLPAVTPNPPLDPQSEQQRLFESGVALCEALAAAAPLLLVLEDAHWADSGSLALLRHLARRTRRQRVLLVATYREVELDETRPFQDLLVDLHRERLAARIKLARLDRAGTRDLLASLFDEEITPEFLEGIYAETEGNPFFVEEVCKALVDGGHLQFEAGRWRRPGMEEMVIPPSVRAAIGSRVGRLPAPVQEVLQVAAVLGREFDFDMLAAAAGLDEEALIGALETAEHAQLIAEVKGARQVRFAFAHALIPAALLDGLHTLRRRKLHRRAAAAVERLRPDDHEALAHHYAAAGAEAEALLHLVQAGERASAAYANVEAGRHFRAALELAEAGPERARLLEELGRALERQDQFAAAHEAWQAAVELHRAEGRGGDVARLHARMARAAWYAGDTPRGLALCRQGLAEVGAGPDCAGLADLLHETARACHFNGLPGEAGPLCRRAQEMAERAGDPRVLAEALTTWAILPDQTWDEQRTALMRAVELAEAAGLLRQAARAHNNLGFLLLVRRGDLPRSRTHYLRSAELSRLRASPAEELFSRASAVLPLILQGGLVRAGEELEALRHLADATPDPGIAAVCARYAEALLCRYRGELDEAADLYAAVQTEAQSAGDLQFESGASQELLDLRAEQGQEPETQAALAAVLALDARGLGGGFRARCRAAQFHARRGHVDEARRWLAEARALHAEPGTGSLNDFYQARALAALAAAEGRWDEALALHAQLRAGLKSAELHLPAALALLEWADALLLRGGADDRGRARELLAQAEAEFAALGATGYRAIALTRLDAA